MPSNDRGKNQEKFEPLGDVLRAEVDGSSVIFRCSNALLSITARHPRVIRLRLTFQQSFPPDHSFAVLPPPSGHTLPSLKVREEEWGWSLSTGSVQIHVRRNPCHVTFLDAEGHTINRDAESHGVEWDRCCIRCSKDMPSDEHYYGFGHKGRGLDKRGCRMEMWNQYAPYTPETDPLSVNVPFLLALRRGISYGLFFDTPARALFDMGATNARTYTFTAWDDQLDYYFIYGPDPGEVLHLYSQLTGTMPLPPRWTLGFHQCRFSYPDEQTIRRVASQFRNRSIPCDAIWFDIHYMNGFRVFTWDRKAFPDPKGLIADLAAQGFHSVVIIDPGVKKEDSFHVYSQGLANNYFLRKDDGSLLVATAWPGESVLPDFFNPDVRRWWGDLHASLVEQGVAAIWNDLNEPQFFVADEYKELERVIHSDGRRTYPHPRVHNAYPNMENQATFEALLRLRPDRRPWILSRAGWAGVQRYAAIWTADNRSTWEHLRVTVPMLLNLSLAGIPMVGADVGGFFGDCTPELFARWIQMAVFTPFCRCHTNMGTADQEPWAFGSRVEGIARRYIELRYQLLPYIYDLAWEAVTTGLPIMRPLFLEFPSDERTYTIGDQFLLGSSLLVAPVLEEGAKSRQLYLPSGEWVEWTTQKRHRGQTEIEVPAPLRRCPLFVRAGSILPLQPVVQHTGKRLDQLHLHIYPPRSGSSEYLHYEDDGETLAHQRGEWATTQYWCHTETDRISLHILPRQGPYNPGPRNYRLHFHTLPHPPNDLHLNGCPLPLIQDKLRAGKSGWTWRPHEHTVVAWFPDLGTRMEITLLMD